MVINNTGDQLYVADETAHRITIINTTHQKIANHIDLAGKPGGLTLSPDETILYVTLALPEGKLIEIDLSTRQILRTLDVGHTPMSPIVSPDGYTLYLSNRFDNNVCSIDLKSFTIAQTTSVDREPVAIVLSPKANKLFVANHLPNGRTAEAHYSSKVSVLDALTLKPLNEISLPNGANALNQITISPDEKFAYVTHILARYNVPTNQVERGWINTNALSIIDIESNKYHCTVLLDDLDRGAANPYDVKCSEDGTNLFVSHTGTSELSIIDRKTLHKRFNLIESGAPSALFASSLEGIQNDLSFLQDIRTRIDLIGKGAKGIAPYKNKIYVAMYFSGSVEEITHTISASSVSISLGRQPDPSPERLGEIYFNDATLCKQHWQSCTSCHPGNARVDALNWDNMNDGIGNPKNTKSMLLAHATPPSMITGMRADASLAVRAGIEHILFTTQTEEVAAAIDAYLSHLTPVPSPYLENGKPSMSAIQGKEIYNRSGCSQCHTGPYLTNLKLYDVGTGTGLEKGRKFDTPSLIEIWRTAPYLYDGKAKDLKVLFTTFNKSQKHGNTSDLTPQELDDLIAYCLSL